MARPNRFQHKPDPLEPPCTEEALKTMYARCRDQYFCMPDGSNPLPEPSEVTVEWTTRATASAGLCYPKRRLIRLSVHYHVRHPQDVEATLLHEMIHLIVPGHGPGFHAWMRHIQAAGGRVFRYAKERAKPAPLPRWVYTCVTCGGQFRYRRRLNQGGKRHRCRRCGPEKGRLVEEKC